ncbi:hypothetical protein [Oceaniovalibus sp. ACAM 378]|uniref:hypothetical protein n=1 Tax=Oceaniovalibus sp. ACAM 378 TaxID=2599923 RepID=UPI0011D9D881|nr:hypothetical protein [Oceaniovalibus sp. ACAM 378]TYB89163.1 hypothetical protein FQ320_09610 [Oceaniovalibus sp. ACAM 378]
MLAGLIFLGVLAAASFPDLMEGAQTDETDHPEDAEPSLEADDPTMPEDSPHGAVTAAPENGPAGGDVSQETPEVLTGEEDLTGEEELTGEDLFVDPEPGLVLVESFKPGVDTLTVAVPDDAQEFTAHDSDGDSAAYLRFDTAMGTVEIRFQGLSVVPVDDLFLRVSDASSPTLDADIPLSALMDTDADEVEGPVLTPVDPEFPDDVPAPGPDDPVLSPADPTLPDDPPAPGADDPTVLTPVLDDVAPTPEYDVSEDDAGALLPSGDDDTRDIAAHDRVLAVANRDDASPHAPVMTPVSEPNDGSRGAEGPGLTPVADDTGFAEQAPDVHDSRTTEGVWLYSTSGSQADVADITDFLRGEDVLRISLNPAAIDSGNVSVLPSGDGEDALVTIDGKVIAILRGAPEATLRDVFVETRPDMFG